MLNLDTTKRAARMLEAGRVTMTFRSPSGSHITLMAKCRGKNESGKWIATNLADAKLIFIEVPNETGWNDKVGKVTSRGFTPDSNADEARIFCAKQMLSYLTGGPTANGLEIFEEDRCGKCGRALTDPISIQRGIGPECYGAMTGSEHETKQKTENPTASAPAAPAPEKPAPAPEREYQPSSPSPRKDNLDKNGAPYVGDWRARKQFAKDMRSDDTKAEPVKESSQLTTLPGETWEDIFRPQAERMGVELPAN